MVWTEQKSVNSQLCKYNQAKAPRKRGAFVYSTDSSYSLSIRSYMASTSEWIKALIGGPSDFAVGWLLILLSSLITIIIASITVIKWVSSKLGEKGLYVQKIHQLVIGMHIRNFENILGNPVFINQLDGDLQDYREFLFSNQYFFTQAIINANEEVILFSVTSKQRDFNPEFHIGGPGNSTPYIKLGKTTFAEIRDEPGQKFEHYDHGGVGFYTELFYFGRPGHYLHYAFSLNINGTPSNFDFLAGLSDRSKACFNTFTVISEIDTDKLSKIILGPRTGQVWNLRH